MEWIVTGNIPTRVNSKDSKVKSIDKIRLFNDLRTAEFDSDDINNIIKILKERNYLYSAVESTSKGSITIEDFLENFWDYDKSPYVKEKLGKKQSIHRQYCATLLSRTRLYWISRLAGKCVAEITRKDVDAFFSSDEAQKLAPKTINSIIETITIPLKWAYYNELTQNNCFDGIIKCSNQSKERKVIDMDTANRLMKLEWDNDEAKIANELAMHTGMRAGEIQALTVDDLGEDEIYVRRSWSKYDGLKCCKNGEERSVPIPISHQLYLKLKMLADFNPHGNGFIFYSTVKDKPMDSKQFNKYLKRALAEIANDMRTNGFDKSRPIIVTEAYIIVDGHSRFMTAKKAGLEKVLVIVKKFDSRDETIEYEYKMQLNSRRLTDGEYFAAFLKLDEIRRSNPNAQGSSDEAIGRQLNKSARQVCKMHDIAKKADASLLEKIQNGSISIST